MAARMMKLQTVIDPHSYTRSTPTPTASSPDPLYAMLLAHGRSRVDVKLQSNLQVRRPRPAPPREAVPDRHVTVYGEILDPWISALRSGRYSQHRGNWHYRDGVCAVEVALHELGYEDSGPREPLIAKIGFEVCSWVMALNDSAQWSFGQIADWLETHPTRLRS